MKRIKALTNNNLYNTIISEKEYDNIIKERKI